MRQKLNRPQSDSYHTLFTYYRFYLLLQACKQEKKDIHTLTVSYKLRYPVGIYHSSLNNINPLCYILMFQAYEVAL